MKLLESLPNWIHSGAPSAFCEQASEDHLIPNAAFIATIGAAVLGLVAIHQAARSIKQKVSPITASLKRGAGSLQNIFYKYFRPQYFAARQEAIRSLRDIHVSLATDVNIDTLLKSGPNAEELLDGIKQIYRTNPRLLIPNNINALRGAGKYAGSVGVGIRLIGRNLATQDNFNALIKTNANVASVDSAIFTIRKNNGDLMNQQNFDTLIRSAANTGVVGRALDTLYEVDPTLLNQRNFDALIASGRDAAQVTVALHALHATDTRLVNQQNFDTLIASGPNAVDVATRRLMGHHQPNFQSILACCSVDTVDEGKLDASWSFAEKGALVRFYQLVKDTRFINAEGLSIQGNRWLAALDILSKALKLAVSDRVFADQFKEMLLEYTTSCVDRASVGFVYLDMMTQFHLEPSAFGKYSIALALQKAKALESIAASIAGPRNGHESIETFLKLLIQLKEKQRLPFSLDKMQFEHMAQINASTIQEADHQMSGLNEIFLASKNSDWRTFLFTKNQDGIGRYNTIRDNFYKKLADLEELKKSLRDREYQDRMSTLVADREKALDSLAIEMTKNISENSRSEDEKKHA